jgi:hypothetical protein
MKLVFVFLSFLMLTANCAFAQSCITTGDQGRTKCLANLIYRCVCTTINNMTNCAWNNASVACQAPTDGGAAIQR